MRNARQLLTVFLMCAVPLYGFAALVEQCCCAPRGMQMSAAKMPCHGRHADHHRDAPTKPTHCKFGEKCRVGCGVNQTAMQWTTPILPGAPLIAPAAVQDPPAFPPLTVWRPPRL